MLKPYDVEIVGRCSGLYRVNAQNAEEAEELALEDFATSDVEVIYDLEAYYTERHDPN